MASPDVTPYTELTLLDVDAQDLVTAAVARLAVTFPEWVPREGHTEVLLLEQLAALAESTVYATNRLPDGMTEVLLRLFGLERSLGVAPSAVARFDLADTAGHTIPAGTLVRVNRGANVEPVDLTTDADLVVAPGSSQGTVGITGDAAGIDGNGVTTGTLLELLDSITFVNTVTLTTPLGGGVAPEDGAAFLARGIPILSRLTTTLVRPADIEAYVIDQAVAQRVKVLDLYDPDDPDAVPGDNPGFVTVAVTTAGGGALSAPAKAALLDELIDKTHAGLKLAVVDADVNEVDVEVTVLRRPGYSDATVEANVVAILEAYLSPDAWDWSRLVRRNELIAVVDRAVGVDTVLDVVVPASDLELTGVAPLASSGTLTVNIEAP